MDKLRILRSVDPSTLRRLEADEIRLYLLLLASSRDSGEGEVGYDSLRQAFGPSFILEKVVKACRSLRRHGLIEAPYLLPDDSAEQDYVLRYKIVGE